MGLSIFQSETIREILKDASHEGGPYNRTWRDKIESNAEYYAKIIERAAGETPVDRETIERAVEYTVMIFHPVNSTWGLRIAREASTKILRIIYFDPPEIQMTFESNQCSSVVF